MTAPKGFPVGVKELDIGPRFGKGIMQFPEFFGNIGRYQMFRQFPEAEPDVEFFDANGKTLTEVDVWLENGEFAMAVEVKSCLSKQDVTDHLKRMEILRRYLDGRRDTRKLLGAAAGAVFKNEAKEYALENGFYVIEQSGDTVQIKPPEGFKPRIW